MPLPQGSRLGPLSFIVIIDDLATHCGLDKFVDDTTLSELLPPSASVSNIPLYFGSILTWTVNNDMQINISKTKEIILGRISQDNLELLSTPAGIVERVTTFKLLGIHLDGTVTWSTHVNAITSKATKPLYFLKQLTRAGVPCRELAYFIFTPQSSVLSLSTRPPSGIMPSPKHKHSNLSQSRSGQSI